MNIWHLILIVSSMGAIGGLLNCAIAKEFVLPGFDKVLRVWRPGWIGNVLIGAVAAVVVWGIYGPLASYDLVKGQSQEVNFTISQLLTSIIIGLGGGNILTQMAQKQANLSTKNSLTSALQNLTE